MAKFDLQSKMSIEHVDKSSIHIAQDALKLHAYNA